MSGILVVAEIRRGELRTATAELVSAAQAARRGSNVGARKGAREDDRRKGQETGGPARADHQGSPKERARSGTLVVAKTRRGELRTATAELVSAAQAARRGSDDRVAVAVI